MDAIKQDISGEIVLMAGLHHGHLEALKVQEEERRVLEREVDLAEREKGRVSAAKESSAASQGESSAEVKEE